MMMTVAVSVSVIDGPNININMIGVDCVDDVVDDDCDAAAVLTDGSGPRLFREHDDRVNRPLL